jgi:hypothetical protein
MRRGKKRTTYKIFVVCLTGNTRQMATTLPAHASVPNDNEALCRAFLRTTQDNEGPLPCVSEGGARQQGAHCRALRRPVHGKGRLPSVNLGWPHGTIKSIVMRRTLGARRSRKPCASVFVHSPFRAVSYKSLSCAGFNACQRV